MGCKECGKPKCNGKCGCKSPKVLQINNPAEYITFHKVNVPAAMGDSKTNPPAVGKYKNVLLYYEADQTSWLYSTDGIPVRLTNGITNYEDSINLPEINGHTLIGNKTSHELGLQEELTAGDNIQIEGNTISATDTTYTAGDGIEIDGTEVKAKIGDGLEFDNNGEINIADIEQYAHFFDNVAAMQSYNLATGDVAQTLGYHTANDGGAARYKIVDSGATADGGSIIALDNGLKAQLIAQDGTVNVKQFGAIDSNSVDQSQFISMAAAYCFDNGIRKLELNGEYFVDNSISFSNKTDLTISNGTIYVHETAAKLSDNFKVFSFTSCDKINIEKIKIIEIEPVTRARHLYQGGVYFYACHGCRVKDCYFENTHNGVVLQGNSYNCIIEGNNIVVNYHSMQFAESAILNYASYDNVIKNNTITGEYYDGTLSIYGAGCRNVVVDGNIIAGVFDDTITWLSEGITIDAGCDSTIVTNNIISGEYYGIDNKNDSVNTLIANNTIYSCKAGITDRPGEENKQTFNCQIKDNQIVFKKAWDTSTISPSLFSNTYYFVGIYIADRLSCDVNSNKITVYKGIDAKTVCGIYASASTASISNQYQSQFDIKNNTLEFATGFGNSVGNAGTESAGIHIKDIRKGTIIGNSLKVDLTTSNYYFITSESANSYLLITDNNFLATSTDRHKFINMLEDSTISESEVVRNKIKGGYPQINLNDVTNIVEMPRFNIVGHRIKSQNFTANTWAVVCTLKATYAGGFYRIKLQGIKSASGNKYLFAEYVVAIGASTVTATEISKYNDGLDARLVHNTGSNTCDIEVKAGSNLTNFSELFITDIMGDQRLTLINPSV